MGTNSVSRFAVPEGIDCLGYGDVSNFPNNGYPASYFGIYPSPVASGVGFIDSTAGFAALATSNVLVTGTANQNIWIKFKCDQNGNWAYLESSGWY